MNTINPILPQASEQPETIETKMIRWRAEAIKDRESLWPLNRLRLALGGQIRAGSQQLAPDVLDNPMTAMFIFHCPNPKCNKLGKDYRHGFTDSASGRYFICNSCDARFDAHEFVGSTLHFISNLAAMVRLAWRMRTKPKPALS